MKAQSYNCIINTHHDVPHESQELGAARLDHEQHHKLPATQLYIEPIWAESGYTPR